jgi:site-specific recombinase XerD
LIVGASCSGKEAMEMSGTRRKPGRLGPFVEGYRVWLLERGYTPGTVRGMLKVLGQLGRWMEREGREPGQIDVAAVEAFLAFLRSDGHRRVPTVRALRSMSLYLREVGVITVDDGPRELTPVEGLVGAYRDWLVTERGLAAATVLRYENLARRFLTERVSPADELGVEGLSGADVSAFLLRECARVSVGSAKGRVAELRSLLRFLYLRGFTELALADSVPSVAGWRDTSIPATMPRADVERLLASCERAALGGARNFAMLMLLARLGLRSVEVARLELSDLDWRRDQRIRRVDEPLETLRGLRDTRGTTHDLGHRPLTHRRDEDQQRPDERGRAPQRGEANGTDLEEHFANLLGVRPPWARAPHADRSQIEARPVAACIVSAIRHATPCWRVLGTGPCWKVQ